LSLEPLCELYEQSEKSNHLCGLLLFGPALQDFNSFNIRPKKGQKRKFLSQGAGRIKKSRKFDRPPLGLQLLREFSSSPRWKGIFKKKRRIC
jgi:hypothetical protein